ncbi:RHS repeat-associated core domain-containing protein [Anaerohalosphaeraceae bacterium U12dextr]
MNGWTRLCLFVSLIALTLQGIAADCPDCSISSSACRPWGKSRAYFYWAGTNSPDSSIVITAGPCGQAGEGATGYILSVADRHRSECDSNENTNPCNGDTTDAGTYAVIRIRGSQKAFEHIFPDGIVFQGDYSVNDWWPSVSAKQTGCKYTLRLSNPATSRIIVRAAPNQCLPQYSGSSFTIDVRIYQKRDYNNETYSFISNTSGTISVRNNPRTSFDPQNFIPDVRSGTANGYIEKVQETYRVDGDTPWMLPLARNYNCQQGQEWLGGDIGYPYGMLCNEQGTCKIPETATFYRVKYPAFQEAVSGCPPYIAAEGWDYHIGTTQGETYISYTMGSDGTLFFVCNSPADSSGSQKYYISKVIYSPTGSFTGSTNQEKWHCSYEYNSPAKLRYIHTGSDPNDPNNMSTTDKYYQYDWSNENKDVTVAYHDNSDSSRTRQWSVKFDDQQRVIQYQSGTCSSGCGLSEFEHVEYHPDYDDLITKRYNANNQVILENTYDPIIYGEWVDAGWIPVYNWSFELPDVSGCTDQTEIPSWTITNTNSNDVPEICDISQAPHGSQILRPNGDMLTEILSDAIDLRMTYSFKATVRATPGDSQIGAAQITLYSNNSAYSEPLIPLPAYSEPSAQDDTEWHVLEGTWDADSYLGPDDTDLFKIEIAGNHVEIDNIQLSAKVYIENQTKPILVEQKVYDPNTSSMQVSLRRDICKTETAQSTTYWIAEKTYTQPNQYRLVKYVYEDDSYTNILSKTEYDQLNTDPNTPSGETYTTSYSYDSDPNRIIETITYPNGIRQDVKVYDPNSQLTSSYRHDVENNANSFLEQYEYQAFAIPNRYEEYEYKVKKHINPQGGITNYTYQTSFPYLLETRTDPNSGTDRQVNHYYYDGSRRIITETKKASEGQTVSSTYTYDPTTGFLTSTCQGNPQNSATTTSWYNDFGQVIRQTNPDGVKSGKSYGIGGELLSDFVIAENCDPNLPDSQLTLLSQAKYAYTQEGKVEFIYKAKDDGAFAYDDPNSWIITKQEYDTTGRKKKTIEDYNGLNLTTEYFYNLQGEIDKVLYPSGKWTKTIRDGRGLTTHEITGYTDQGQDADVLTTSYDYDDNGNLTEQTGADGTKTLYTYDNLDRVKRVYRDSPDGPYTESFYNAAGDVERQIAVENGTLLSDTRKGYDYQGRLLWQRVCAEPNIIDNVNDLISHTIYDVVGNVRYSVKKDIDRTNFDPDPNDIVTEYRYDILGRKSNMIEPDGVVHTTYYTPAGLPETIIDPNDPSDPNAYITRNTFDAAGRTEKTVNPEGHYVVNCYNSLNQVVKQTVYDCNETPENTADDFAVKQIRTGYDNLGNVQRTVVMRHPDSTEDPLEGYDLITDYTYYPQTGLLYQQTMYYGDTPSEAVTTYYYDSIGRKIRTVDPSGNEEIIVYSSANPAQAEKTELIQRDEEDPQNIFFVVTTFFEYDDFGRVFKKILDVDGDGVKESTDITTTYLYDGLDRIYQEIAPDGVITQSLYDGFGNARQVIEDYGSTTFNKTTEYVYNRLNQLYQVNAYDPNDTTSNIAIQTTEYQYDKVGNVTQITYPDDQFVGYEYTLLNRVATETKRDGTILYSWYDQLGNLTLVSDDENANVGGDPTFKELFRYDGAGNLLSAEKQEDGDTTAYSEFTYNGFGLRESETATYYSLSSITTTWEYDGSGNPVNQTHGDTTLSYTHDGLGRIKAIDRGNDTIVNYTYYGNSPKAIDYPEPVITEQRGLDELGRIEEIKAVDSLNASILDFIYTYDSVGNRRQEKYNHLSAPVWDRYYYDALRRLEQVDYAATSGFARRIDDSRFSIDELVMFASQWVDNGTTDFTDDTDYYSAAPAEAAIRPLPSKASVSSEAKLLTLSEFGTANSNLKAETLRNDDGVIIAQIVYDASDRITLFTLYPDSGGKVVVFSTYDEDGTLISQICSTYNADGNLMSRESLPLVAETDVLSDSLAAVSALSLSSTLDTEESGTMTLMMTPTSQNSRTDEFDYDHLGNRYQVRENYGLLTNTKTYSHNSLNQYSGMNEGLAGATSSYTYSHDENGNLWIDGYGYTYHYDAHNRLIDVQDGTTTLAEYGYDALGRRIKKTAGGKTTYFYYDTHHQVIAEYEGATPQLVREFVYGNGTDEILAMFLPEYEGSQDDLDQFLALCAVWLSDPNDSNYDDSLDVVNDNTIDLKDFAHFAAEWSIPSSKESHYYYLHDALGSVRGLIGGRFNREEDREFYNYDVYGKPSDSSVPSVAGNPFLFAGYRYDAETSLYHLRFRAYDPASGRFIQIDPIGYADSMNLYEYVTNNPTNYTDPYGLFERNTDSWWKEGFSWSNPLGYFSEENIAKRQQLRQLQQYYEAKYQAVRQERKLRGIDDNWKEECCCVAKDTCVGIIVGIGQGTANTANGLQDAVIGVVNLPASTCNLFGADIYEIPSPDWSKGLLMDEDPFQHQVSKFVGGESAYFLITVGAGNVAKVVKNCKKPANALCDDATGLVDDLLKPADEVVDLSKGAKTSEKAADEAVSAAKKAEQASDNAKMPYSKSRPNYGKDQVDNVWENAKSSDGNVYDPYTGEQLFWDKTKPRNGQWDMGHKYGESYKKLHDDYMSGKISKDEFLKRYRDPQNYHPQSISGNRSQKYD